MSGWYSDQGPREGDRAEPWKRVLHHAKALNLSLAFEQAERLLSDELASRSDARPAGDNQLERLRAIVRINRGHYELRHFQVPTAPRAAPDGAGAAPERGIWSTAVRDGRVELRGATTTPAERVFVFVDQLLFRVIKTTPIADAAAGARRRFYWNFRQELLTHFPSQSALRIVTVHGPLSINGRTRHPLRVPEGKGDLPGLFSAGYVLNKKGVLCLRRDQDRDWQRKVLDAYERLSEYFQGRFGYSLMLCFGTLLGAIRDHDFIPHDDDCDIAWLSRESQPEAVRDEVVHIARTLVDDGWPVILNPLGMLKPFVGHHRGETELIDLQPFWIDDGMLYAQWGTRVPREQADIVPPATIDFKGHQVHVPRDAEGFLALEYGPEWHSPDPSYQPAPADDPEDVLRRARPTRIQLDQFLAYARSRFGNQ